MLSRHKHANASHRLLTKDRIGPIQFIECLRQIQFHSLHYQLTQRHESYTTSVACEGIGWCVPVCIPYHSESTASMPRQNGQQCEIGVALRGGWACFPHSHALLSTAMVGTTCSTLCSNGGYIHRLAGTHLVWWLLLQPARRGSDEPAPLSSSDRHHIQLYR